MNRHLKQKHGGNGGPLKSGEIPSDPQISNVDEFLADYENVKGISIDSK